MNMHQRLFQLTLVAVLGCSSGCSTFSEMLGQKKSPILDTSQLEAQGYSIPPGGMPSPVDLPSGSGPRVVLEVRGDSRHLESIPLPVDRGMFIQDLVQQAELHEQFGQMSVSIMRSNGSGAPPVRMDAKVSASGKVTNVGQNYALLPGDHIIVISDQRTRLERWVEASLKM